MSATCPRRVNESGPWEMRPGMDCIREDDHCSFCGALNPDTFMQRLEAGDISLEVTDKNYKVYVKNLREKGGAPFKIRFKKAADTGTGEVWEDRTTDHTKFYFQHLSDEQRERFVQLYNERKINTGQMDFYVLPFFMVRKSAA
jgi:hypothetical protein